MSNETKLSLQATITMHFYAAARVHQPSDALWVFQCEEDLWKAYGDLASRLPWFEFALVEVDGLQMRFASPEASRLLRMTDARDETRNAWGGPRGTIAGCQPRVRR